MLASLARQSADSMWGPGVRCGHDSRIFNEEPGPGHELAGFKTFSCKERDEVFLRGYYIGECQRRYDR